jgi:Rod binding domain-containing protein
MEINSVIRGGAPRESIERDPKKAAQEFEAILIAQILDSAFNQDSGSDQTMLEYSRSQLSQVIAKGGGLGLSPTIEQGIRAKAAKP